MTYAKSVMLGLVLMLITPPMGLPPAVRGQSMPPDSDDQMSDHSDSSYYWVDSDEMETGSSSSDEDVTSQYSTQEWLIYNQQWSIRLSRGVI